MSNQTPPVIPVSEDQYAKVTQVLRDIARKGNINGPEFQHVIGHPLFKKELDAIVNSKVVEYRQMLPLIDRPGQKLQLGVRKSAEEMRKRLITKGCQIGNWGSDILKHITLVSSPIEIEVVEASNAELGYPGGCTVAQTYEAGLKLGWELCDHEVGPEYLLQDLDLPKGQYRRIAMKPIAVSGVNLRVFGVVHGGGGRDLDGCCGGPDDFYFGGRVWLFRRK